MQWLCSWCRHISQTSRKYGIDPEMYSDRLDAVKNCECCGDPLVDSRISGYGRGIGRFADVPIYGKLRGVLCKKCHTILGWNKGDQVEVLRMFSYLNVRNYQLEETK